MFHLTCVHILFLVRFKLLREIAALSADPMFSLFFDYL